MAQAAGAAAPPLLLTPDQDPEIRAGLNEMRRIGSVHEPGTQAKFDDLRRKYWRVATAIYARGAYTHDPRDFPAWLRRMITDEEQLEVVLGALYRGVEAKLSETVRTQLSVTKKALKLRPFLAMFILGPEILAKVDTMKHISGLVNTRNMAKRKTAEQVIKKLYQVMLEDIGHAPPTFSRLHPRLSM